MDGASTCPCCQEGICLSCDTLKHEARRQVPWLPENGVIAKLILMEVVRLIDESIRQAGIPLLGGSFATESRSQKLSHVERMKEDKLLSDLRRKNGSDALNAV